MIEYRVVDVKLTKTAEVVTHEMSMLASADTVERYKKNMLERAVLKLTAENRVVLESFWVKVEVGERLYFTTGRIDKVEVKVVQ